MHRQMDILQMVKGKLSKILLKLGHILKQDEGIFHDAAAGDGEDPPRGQCNQPDIKDAAGRVRRGVV